MQVPLLYRFSRLLVRTALDIYFTKLEISGARHIPATGPVILASNHPHSITDALILGVGSGDRMVHYVAHSGLFRNRLKAWFLRKCGVIPVYRPHDIQNAADRNVAMFKACRRVLQEGGAIGIFPEGTSEEERRVHKLKTGCARIALESEAEAGWQLGVKIVPVGLNFESRRRFRSRVLLSLGVPLTALDYRDAFQEDPYEAAHRLTATLQEAIRRRVMNISHADFSELVRDMEAIYKAELLVREGLTIPGSTRFKKDQLISREIGRALDYFHRVSPEVITRIAGLLRDYRRELERLSLKDAMLRQEQEHSVRGATARLLVWTIVELPLSLYGCLVNYVPFQVTGWLAVRLAADRTKVHFVQMLGGGAVFLLWYGLLIYLTVELAGPVAATVLAVTAPPAGLFARTCFRHLKRRRQMVRFAYFELKHGYYVQKLRQQRQRVIAEMDVALDEYLEYSRSVATGEDDPALTDARKDTQKDTRKDARAGPDPRDESPTNEAGLEP
jgi:glycerol-3-phosphate O-acyltransferase/dihydroxyacetone phosphate acyltransferase